MPRAGLRTLLLLPMLATLVAAPAAATLRSDRPGILRSQRMQFDFELGVHTLPGRDGVYYFDHSFLRIHEGSWQFGRSADGPWRERPIEWVPLRLRLKHFADER